MKRNPFPIKQINSLDLSFDKEGSAYSNNYGDIYFQPGIGLDEKVHVFLNGNDLPNNWQDKEKFCIAETGFGTGLNFLNTLKLWDTTKQNNQQLHYISCELHPLNKQQLKQALALFPELADYSKILIEEYPQLLMYGFHRIHLQKYGVTLTLIFAECVDAFEQLEASIDAWFLDGFGPSKNPKMWEYRLFKAIANLSHIGTTAATFTVARKIRDGLKSVDFEISKRTGFGQKREMLTAKLVSEIVATESRPKQPWAQTFKANKQQSFTVLGAGIAGLSIADKLQQQGKNVTLIDRQKQPCLETSGNPQAMIMPSFDLNDSSEAQFYLAAFLYAARYYSNQYYHAVGVHDLAFSDKQQIWQDKLLSKFDLPKELIKEYKQGILYPNAGWLDTQGHAKNVFEKISHYMQADISKIEYKNNLWHLYTQDSVVHTTETLILANGINVKKLLPNYELPITPKYGEISYFKSNNIDSQIGTCPHIQLSKGYITPQWKGSQTIGATFDHIESENWFNHPQLSHDHWKRNTELWNNTPYANLLAEDISYKSRAGIRVTTPDHLPICGAVINQKELKKDYHDICHGKHWKQYPLPIAKENLYVLTGLGSRGFTAAPILAEFLCNQILGQPQVINKILQTHINPNRFLFKSIKRSK
jgi:tRNA 5-methylaminomethyl-2-thiouridine biosynthesis bifunctional protein